SARGLRSVDTHRSNGAGVTDPYLLDDGRGRCATLQLLSLASVHILSRGFMYVLPAYIDIKRSHSCYVAPRIGHSFFSHGAQKMLGWFGGPGFSATMQSFNQMGIPDFLAFLAIAAEFFGGLALIVGFLGRVAALGIVINMLVAVFAAHLPNG